MKSSIVLVSIILSLISCKNSNPVNPTIESSSSQKEISSSIKTNSSSNEISSSSQINLSSSSSSIIPPTITTKTLSKIEVMKEFGIQENDISIVEKWYVKWDSLTQLSPDSILGMDDSGFILDSNIVEIYNIDPIAWCEIEGDSFTLTEIASSSKGKNITLKELINLKGEQVLLIERVVNTNAYSSNGTFAMTDLTSYTCNRQQTEIYISPICNDKDNFQLNILWNINNDEQSKLISSPLQAEPFYTKSLGYYYDDFIPTPCPL